MKFWLSYSSFIQMSSGNKIPLLFHERLVALVRESTIGWLQLITIPNRWRIDRIIPHHPSSSTNQQGCHGSTFPLLNLHPTTHQSKTQANGYFQGRWRHGTKHGTRHAALGLVVSLVVFLSFFCCCQWLIPVEKKTRWGWINLWFSWV